MPFAGIDQWSAYLQTTGDISATKRRLTANVPATTRAAALMLASWCVELGMACSRAPKKWPKRLPSSSSSKGPTSRLSARLGWRDAAHIYP